MKKDERSGLGRMWQRCDWFLRRSRRFVSSPLRLGLNHSHSFIVAAVVVMVCSFAIGFGLVSGHYRQFRATQATLPRLVGLRIILDAANRISAERGPSNRVISEPYRIGSPSLRLLEQYRAETDRALEDVSKLPGFRAESALIENALKQARLQIDVLAKRDPEARTSPQVAGAVEQMFAVYDANSALVQRAASELIGVDTALMGQALTMQLLCDLRDSAGRMGSHIVIPMALGEPMGTTRRAQFELTRGRVLTLWPAISQATRVSTNQTVLEARKQAEEVFFGVGLPLMERTARAAAHGHYSSNATGFTKAVVPTFAPLERLRDAYAQATIAELEKQAYRRRQVIVVAGIATVMALIVQLMLLIGSQTELFSPLLRARRHVIAMARNELEEEVETPRRHREMQALFQALEALRQRLVQRNIHERKRSDHIMELKRLAQTDSLTGVINRGALESLVQDLTELHPAQESVGLILLDIDHFKSINDVHGHLAGDQVLQALTARLSSVLRPGDVLARIGGEEFAVLLPSPGEDAPEEVAERLRRTIHDRPVVLSSGVRLLVTASFGVAVALGRPGFWQELMLAADKALYRAKSSGRNRIVHSK